MYSIQLLVAAFGYFSLGFFYVTSTTCPLENPYAYHGGKYCCHYAMEKSAYEQRTSQDANCDGSEISLASECCKDDHFVPCTGVSCETPPFNVSEPCPEDYPNPYFYGLYCCKYSTEKETFQSRTLGYSCQNGTLSLNSMCCLGDSFILCSNPPCTGSPWWGLTWHAEGNDNPADPNFSRKLRVPSGKGLTIGKGYDMKDIWPPIINSELQSAGVSAAIAQNLSAAHGLTGSDAINFIINKNLVNFALTHQQQWNLFKMMRDKYIVQAKTSSDFDTRHSSIQGIIIDLLWTGDYTTSTKAFLQTTVDQNSVTGLTTIMSNRTKWPGVTDDRFNRRKVYMEKASL